MNELRQPAEIRFGFRLWLLRLSSHPQKKPFIEIDWFEDSKEEAQRKIDLVKRGEARFDRHPLDTLPSHHGYKQLAIILEKRGDYVAAAALSEQAREQGWKGDWDTRIARLNKRIAKLSN